jgi:hypothetical protein
MRRTIKWSGRDASSGTGGARRFASLGCALSVFCLAGVAQASAAPATDRPAGIAEVRFDLGEEAFTPPASVGYTGRSELSGSVYYPRDVSHGKHPLVLLQHGSWETCADRAAATAQAAAETALARAEAAGDQAEADRQQALVSEAGAKLWAWPCAAGVGPIPSSQGYAYLARDLAAKGFVVVSMGTNGINATAGGQADTVYQARAALINRYLTLWERLARTGEGPLRGAFTSPGTGAPVTVDFRHHIDMTDVGLLGHSMGGGGVMQEIADRNRSHWPHGVDIKAAFTLAPTDTWDGDPVTKTPFAVMWGTCDMVNTGEFFERNAGHNTAPVYKYTAVGGNHAYYNTQWSPSSHQVASRDDAVAGTRPGTCLSQYPGQPHTEDEQLTETRQRTATVHRVTAFFQRFLRDDTTLDPYLAGERPFPGEPDSTVSTLFDPGN